MFWRCQQPDLICNGGAFCPFFDSCFLEHHLAVRVGFFLCDSLVCEGHGAHRHVALQKRVHSGRMFACFMYHLNGTRDRCSRNARLVGASIASGFNACIWAWSMSVFAQISWRTHKKRWPPSGGGPALQRNAASWTTCDGQLTGDRGTEPIRAHAVALGSRSMKQHVSPGHTNSQTWMRCL